MYDLKNYKIKAEPVILGIESSCDETACAVIKGRKILSDIIVSSASQQALYGGVVPEIASRAHTDAVDEAAAQALKEAGISPDEVDAVAVTYGAGLLGALLVGLSFAKAFAHAKNIPLIAVNHIRGHMAAAYLVKNDLKPPFITLLASGGHTAVLHTKSVLEAEVLASTCDDAAGEAFDKVARVLGLPYPGGPNVQKLAEGGRRTIEFPSALIRHGDGKTFSYSGLKTAVINYMHSAEQRGQSACGKVNYGREPYPSPQQVRLSALVFRQQNYQSRGQNKQELHFESESQTYENVAGYGFVLEREIHRRNRAHGILRVALRPLRGVCEKDGQN